MSQQDILDKTWETVDIQVTYVDRGKTKVKVITLDRQTIEAEERQAAIEQAKEYIEFVGATEERAQEILAEAEGYQVTPETFKARVLDAASQLSSRPLPVESPISNQVRILPPWAVKEVSVQVRNVPPIYTSE